MQIKTEPTTYRSSEVACFMRSQEQHGGLSNMTSGFPLEVNGIRFQGPEGLYQALKFSHIPEVQKHIARQRSGMDAKKRAYADTKFRPDWYDIQVTAMAYTLAVKLDQHPEKFGAALLATRDKPIVEMSYRDPFWGVLPNQDETTLTGVNVLGQLLTGLRDELRRQEYRIDKTVKAFLQGVYAETLLVNGRPVEKPQGGYWKLR